MTARTGSHIAMGFVALAALCAPPVAAQGDAGTDKSATGGQPLIQALTTLSTSNGFEVRGLDKLGDETVRTPKSGTPVQTLRRMLDGYAYTLELAPSDPAGKNAGKILRVSILGHAGDAAGDQGQSTASAAATTAATPTVDTDGSGAPVHPVTHMLQTIARSTIPQSLAAANATAAGQPGLVAAGSAGAAAPTAAASNGASGGDTASSTTDMAALTRMASANLSSLVQSLKAACPAGGKC